MRSGGSGGGEGGHGAAPDSELSAGSSVWASPTAIARGSGGSNGGGDSNKRHASRRGGKGNRSALKGKTRSGGNGEGEGGGGTTKDTSQRLSVDAATATSAISAAKNGDRIELKYTKGGRYAVWNPGTITSRKRGSKTSFNVTMDDGEKQVCDLSAATWRFEPTESAAPSVDELLGESLSCAAVLGGKKADYFEMLLDKLQAWDREALPPWYRSARDIYDPAVRRANTLKKKCPAVYAAWNVAWERGKKWKMNEKQMSTEKGKATKQKAQKEWLKTPRGAERQKAAETKYEDSSKGRATRHQTYEDRVEDEPCSFCHCRKVFRWDGSTSAYSLASPHVRRKMVIQMAALKRACQNGDRDLVKRLLDQGADMAQEQGIPGTRSTALMVACQNGHRDVAELLLDRGANVGQATQGGGTALLIACLKGHRAVAELLLDRGANVGQMNQDGGTALAAARYAGHDDVAELLLSRGADEYEGAVWGPSETFCPCCLVAMDIAKVCELIDAGIDVRYQVRECVCLY